MSRGFKDSMGTYVNTRVTRAPLQACLCLMHSQCGNVETRSLAHPPKRAENHIQVSVCFFFVLTIASTFLRGNLNKVCKPDQTMKFLGNPIYLMKYHLIRHTITPFSDDRSKAALERGSQGCGGQLLQYNENKQNVRTAYLECFHYLFWFCYSTQNYHSFKKIFK